MLPLAVLWASEAAAQVVEYYHLDAVGNVRVVTNQAGQVVERHDYLPFGEECTTGPCSSNPGVGAGQTRKFTGKERDSETGLDYFGARYYQGILGRFISVDPVVNTRASLAEPQRWNRYAYALNSPLRVTDPDGREPNKSQVTDPNRLRAYVQKVAGSTAGDKLKVLGEYRTLGGSDPSHKRYLYTEKAGWLDLVHFFNVARELDRLPALEKAGAWALGGFSLWQKTKEIEGGQAAKGSAGTAWSYEDAPSNYFGWLFWRGYYDPKGDLGEQLGRFLGDYGGTTPENAPNWKAMWRKEQPYKQQFPPNKSFDPKFTQ